MKLERQVNAVIDHALGNKIVGCVVLVKHKGVLIYQRAAGFADRERGLPTSLNTIFRLASVTKPIVATACLRTIEEGLLTFDDPIAKFIPWFQPKTRDGKPAVITINHLLTHTSGISYDVPPSVAAGLAGPIISLKENLKRLALVPLAFAPGENWIYGMSIDVLGAVLASIENSSLQDVVAQYVTIPLGMVDTKFSVADVSRVSVAYADGQPPRIMRDPDIVPEADGPGVVFSPGRIFNSHAPQSGGAGMAGTAGDIMTLLDVYQSRGTFLKLATRESALADQTAKLVHSNLEEGRGFCLIGGVVNDPAAAGTPCSIGSVDWGGVYGHSWIVDPARELTTVICTNTALEGCLGSFPKDIRNAIYAQ